MRTTKIGSTAIPARRGVLSTAVYLSELIVVAAVYFGLAFSAKLVPAINPAASPLWPPTGIALALVLLRGYRIWPAILVGSCAAGVMAADPLPAAGVVAVGAVLAALAGAWLTERWADGRKVFTTPVGIAKFALLAFLPVALIGAAAAVGGRLLAPGAGVADMGASFTTWWLADAAGTLLSAPVLMLWATTALTRSTLLETAGVLFVTADIAFAAYGPQFNGRVFGAGIGGLLPYRDLLGFLVVLPLLWASLRGSRRDAASIALIFVGFAVWAFSAGTGPFARADIHGALLLLFALAMAVSLPALLMSAATAGHNDRQARSLAMQKRLGQQLSDTTRALQSAKRHFQILIEGVADYAIFVVDTAGRVASWNSAAQQITGYAGDEIIGKHFGILYRPDERRAGEPNRALDLAIQQGRCEMEGWRMRKNGTPLFVTGSVSSIHDDNGKLVGFANIIRDATERRDAQEKLVQAREQLAMAQKMEAIGKLTGGIAHDFNNLLMIIGGNAQTFRRLLDPKLPRAIEAIQTAAKRGESLTRQLLTFSRRQHLSPTVVDLGASVRNMRTMIESSLRGNIVYNEQVGTDIWPVKVDLAELELAIVNLSVNARDAMPNGGTFTLTVANVTPAHKNAHESGALVMIEFRDTGTGIPPNLLPKIFDPFFTTKEVGKGTGLGLSQVYGFAHQAGGTVTAESKVGQGTTLRIYLPSCTEQEVAGKEVPVLEAPRPLRPRVLVVDDSAEVAEVTSSLFEHLGYETVYRDSAEAALKLLEEDGRFDLVFSDIVMPGTIDGVGLVGEIRTRYPDLPVILTTGYSDAAQAAPADLRILRKPFDSDALRGFIRDTVELSPALQ